MKTYKDLKLNPENIHTSVELWCLENNSTISNTKNLKNNSEQYLLLDENKNLFLLNVYYKPTSVTLTPTGINIAKSVLLIDFIISNCPSSDKSIDTHFSLKDISEQSFLELIQHLKNIYSLDKEINTTNEQKISFVNMKRVGIHSNLKEIVYLTHYKTQSFLMQGRRNSIFFEVINYFSGKINKEIIIKAQLETFNDTKNISADDSLELLKNKLSNVFNYLPEELHILMAPTITLNSLHLDLTDYSCIAFPVLKGLEGVLKLIFKNAGKIIDNNGFGKYMEYEKIKLDCISQFDSHVIEDIEKLYLIYKKYRHPIFHIDGNITTIKIIDKKEEIEELINEVLLNINLVKCLKR